MIKLEAGKKYVLRNGDIEECLAVWAREHNNYQATVTIKHGVDVYTINGKCYYNGTPSAWDIAAEYKEPVRVADYLIPEPVVSSVFGYALWLKETYPIGQQPEGAVLVPGSERDGG